MRLKACSEFVPLFWEDEFFGDMVKHFAKGKSNKFDAQPLCDQADREGLFGLLGIECLIGAILSCKDQKLGEGRGSGENLHPAIENSAGILQECGAIEYGV